MYYFLISYKMSFSVKDIAKTLKDNKKQILKFVLLLMCKNKYAYLLFVCFLLKILALYIPSGVRFKIDISLYRHDDTGLVWSTLCTQ